MAKYKPRGFTQRSLDSLTIEGIRNGELAGEDFRISADTLRAQADAAASAGYPELAQSLRRAAELTRLSNEEVLKIYDKLRPGRADDQTLSALAERLEKRYDAPMTASFIREAAQVYRQRGIMKALD
jgi:propanediol dehydratase small subunit